MSKYGNDLVLFSCGKLPPKWEYWKTHLLQNSVFLRICIDHLRVVNIYFFFLPFLLPPSVGISDEQSK